MSEPLPDAPSFITRYRWRLRLGTALAVVLITTTVITSWYYFVRAPGPRSVCDHVAQLRRHFPKDAPGLEDAVTPLASGEAPRAITNTTDQLCMWYFTAEQKERSFTSYGRLVRCVDFAETPRELYSCL